MYTQGGVKDEPGAAGKGPRGHVVLEAAKEAEGFIQEVVVVFEDHKAWGSHWVGR